MAWHKSRVLKRSCWLGLMWTLSLQANTTGATPTQAAAMQVAPVQAATTQGDVAKATTTPTRVVEERLSVGVQPQFGLLHDIDGKPLRLEDSSKPTVLIFFATWCHDSQRLMRQLSGNSRLLQQARFIAFGRGEHDKSLHKFRQQYHLPIRYIADPNEHYFLQVTNTGMPRVILLDEQQRVVKTFLGEIPDAMAEIVWPTTPKLP